MLALPRPLRQAAPTFAANVRTDWWHWSALAGLLLVAAALDCLFLGEEGYGNLYYAAGVRSMLTSWHAFFFAAFDPGGFVTIDKPPLGFWLQATSARLLGFSGPSILLPQALAGVLSVAVLYALVRRAYGTAAGLLAGLFLALTPISVATNRNNTIDSLLVLTVLLATWAAIRATETGRLRWLLLATATVGVGFNIKMLEAFLVLPALYLLYLVAAPPHWPTRLLHLAAATVVLAVVALSWAVVVDLTPTADRPFVGSSEHNSVLELVVWHNGLSRVLPGQRMFGGPAPAGWFGAPAPGGQPGGAGSAAAPGNPAMPASPGDSSPAAAPGDPSQSAAPDAPSPSAPPGAPTPGGAPGGFAQGANPNAEGPAGQFGGFGIGPPGPFRLFSDQLGGQIGWLLPLALLGIVAAAWATRRESWRARSRQAVLLWGGWLLLMGGFFSATRQFQAYYLVMLAPAIAACAAIGLVTLWRAYRGDSPLGWLLPLVLYDCALVQVTLLVDATDWGDRLLPWIGGLALLGLALLVVGRGTRGRRRSLSLTAAAAGLGVLALLVAPAVWAGLTVVQGAGPRPRAGPAMFARAGRPGFAPRREGADYLVAQRGDARFLVATVNANTAAPLILATGQPVMAVGGFSGGDPILTVDEFAARVADGAVRYALFPSATDQPGGGPRFGRGQQQPIVQWVQERCSVVPAADWQPQDTAAPSDAAGSDGGAAAGPVRGAAAGPGRGAAARPGGGAPPGQGNFRRGGFGPGGRLELFDCATAAAVEARPAS
jgi:4-amino-4-deoxy-L-arabinose transferase-like glycosyltransferase